MKKETKTANKPAKLKPVKKVVALNISGADAKGNEYDPESVKIIMTELQEAGCFDKLSIPVAIEKKYLNGFDESIKGKTNLARLLKYDASTNECEILLIGKNAEHAGIFDSNISIVPKVFVPYKTTEVKSILSFDFVIEAED